MTTKKSIAEERDREPVRYKGAPLALRRVLVLLAVSVCVLFAIAFGREQAHACKCAQSTPEERLQKSSTVFSGVAAEVEEDASSDAQPQRTTFKVEQSWKGVSKERVVVQGDGSICDIPFQEGERYLVYATGGGKSKEGTLRTSRCQGTRVLKEPLAVDDLQTLGPPQWTSETNTSEKAMEGPGGGIKSKVLPRTGGGNGVAPLILTAAVLIVSCVFLIRRMGQ